MNPVNQHVLGRQPPFRNPAPRAKQHHLRVSLNDHGPSASHEVIEHELGDIRVGRWMELGFGVLDDIDSRPSLPRRERRDNDWENMRETPAGVLEPHVGAVGPRWDNKFKIAALRHDIDAHSESFAIPLANRCPQLVVRRQSQGRVVPIRPESQRRAFGHRKWRREDAARKVRLMGRGPVSAGRVFQVISGHAACATVPRSHVRWLGEPPPRRSDRVSPGGESCPPGAPGPSAASPDRCPTPSTRRARPATRPARLDAGRRHRHA